jgi:aromatase
MSAHTDNQVVIAAPLEVVWDVANDIERWPELFAGEYAAAEVLERDEDRVRFRLTTAPGPDGDSHCWVSERCLDRQRRTVSARRVEPGPFRYMHLFNSFTSVEGGTRLRWIQDFESRPDAPFTDEEMRRRIDAGSRVNLRRHKVVIEGMVAAAGAAGAAGTAGAAGAAGGRG